MSLSPRPYTEEEAREAFLGHLRALIVSWESLPQKTSREKLEGLAFSILSTLDGCSRLPAMDLVLRPHETDEAYCRETGENWWLDGMVINETMLHEQFVR